MRRRRAGRVDGSSGTVLATVLLAVSLLTTALPIDAATADREQALAALAMRDDVEARRRGAEALGEWGVMADVPALTAALRDPDAEVRALAERSLWLVWSRSGDPAIDRRFLQGVEQMQRQELDDAIETFTDIIARKPEFAEGWNKRATAYYLAGELDRSLADCDEVMKRNPVHFGALSGYGMIYLQLGKPDRRPRVFRARAGGEPQSRGDRGSRPGHQAFPGTTATGDHMTRAVSPVATALLARRAAGPPGGDRVAERCDPATSRAVWPGSSWWPPRRWATRGSSGP